MERFCDLVREIENFKPFNEQEEKDKNEILRYISQY